MTPRSFRQQLAIVMANATSVAAAHVVVFDGTKLPPRAAITFDDGYQDVLRHAALDLGGARDFGGSVCDFRSYRWENARSDDHCFMKRACRRGLCDRSHTLTHRFWRKSFRHGRAGTAPNRSSNCPTYWASRSTCWLTRMGHDRRCRCVIASWRAAGCLAAFSIRSVLCRGQDRYALSRCKVLGTDSLQVFRASLCGQLDLWRNRRDP